MEETVCIVKPDAVAGGLTERILTAAEQSGFYIVRQSEKRLTPARAREFYRHLEGTPQFRVTAEFMSSGPVVVAVLSKVDAVNAWRELVGPADPNVARETSPGSLRAQLGVDALRNVVHGSATVQEAAREKAFLFPQGPLPSLIPKEYLLETLVMPGLVEALGELYLAQPPDPYEWMSQWFHTNFPPGRDVNEEWPEPALGPLDMLEEAVGHMCHRRVLGAPLYDATWNFRRCKDRDPVYVSLSPLARGMGMSEAHGARTVADGLRRSGHRQIAWVFLADEPVVYMSGVPVTPVPAVDDHSCGGDDGGGGGGLAAGERLRGSGDSGHSHLDLAGGWSERGGRLWTVSVRVCVSVDPTLIFVKAAGS